jgi:hypothetical protein
MEQHFLAITKFLYIQNACSAHIDNMRHSNVREVAEEARRTYINAADSHHDMMDIRYRILKYFK